MKSDNNWMKIWNPDDEMLARIERLTINNNSSDFNSFWINEEKAQLTDVVMGNNDSNQSDNDSNDDMDIDYPDSDDQLDVDMLLSSSHVELDLPKEKEVLYNKYTSKKEILRDKRVKKNIEGEYKEKMKYESLMRENEKDNRNELSVLGQRLKKIRNSYMNGSMQFIENQEEKREQNEEQKREQKEEQNR